MPRQVQTVAMGFEPESIRVSFDAIRPLKLVTDNIRISPKYAQIAASIRDVGLVEPPVICHDRSDLGKYLLLDGHLRLDVLKEMGQTEVVCLLSTDDEAYTYNKRVNRLAIIQEYRMILKAIERGVSEERIARALNVDVGSIRRKRRLLDGICAEAADLLKDKHVSIAALWEMKKLKPFRQIEAVELMLAMNKFTISYARSLVAATPQAQLVASDKPKKVRGISTERLAMMEREAGNLDREFKVAEQSYGTNHLDLVLARGYVSRLISNSLVSRYLKQNHPELLLEFRKFTVAEATAA